MNLSRRNRMQSQQPRLRATDMFGAVIEMLETRRLLAESAWAFPAADDHLIYHTTPLGDRIPDFSNVGYKAGLAPIPDVPVAATVAPVAGDDRANIQAAIDAVEALPLDASGLRGAVLLLPGEYQIGSSITINASGVVLRGSGVGNTIIRATGTGQRTIINVSGSGTRSEVSGTRRNITDKYVPTGAYSFRVDNPSGYAVGDNVIVYRPSPQNWIDDLGMNLLDNPWTAGSRDMNLERVVTQVEGNLITLDGPISQAIDQEYGGGQLYKYTASGRISNVGVEHLTGISDFDHSVMSGSTYTDEDHPWRFINLSGVINGWVRNTQSKYFGNGNVTVGGNSKWVTVQDSECLDPVSQITGGRRYSFNLDDASHVLFKNLHTRLGRHDYVEGSLTYGPNVFVDSRADSARSDTGPHHRYSTVALWDNLDINGHQINIQNRGNSGSGHGWAGANQVVWNSEASSFTIQNPPTAYNWAIGNLGGVNSGSPGLGTQGIYDSHGAHVETRSLYYAQFAERQKYNGYVQREVRLGDIDNYVDDGASDDVAADSSWQTSLGSLGLPVGQFDQTGSGRLVPFTFNYSIPAGSYIVGASLTLGLKSSGGSTESDRIYFEHPSRSYTYSELGVSAPGTAAGARVIDLTVLLAALQEGKLNVAVAGNTALDWATLTFQTASIVQPAHAALTPIADAYVRDGSSNSNFGSQTALDTQLSTSGSNRETFLRFDLSAVTGTVTGAYVRLVPTAVGVHTASDYSSANGGIGAIFNQLTFVSDDTWTEGGITWNNRPAGGTVLDEWISRPNALLTFDVTSLVMGELAGDKKLSMRIASLTNDGDGLISYASREHGNALLRPELVLTTVNTLAPVADAYVRDGASANTNFGTQTDLAVKWDTSAGSGNNRDAYLRFDLSSLPNAPPHASVRLTPISVGAPGVAGVANFVPSDSWTETGITWNNKPAYTTQLGTWPMAVGVPSSFDVTAQATAAFAGDKLFSVRVSHATQNAGVNQYASREHSEAALRPLLTFLNLAPMITSILNISSDSNAPTPPMWFGIWDAETALNSLTVAASSSNTTLLPNGNIVLSGSGADRFVSLTPASNQTGSSNVIITVTDAAGATASWTFVYSVVAGLVVNGDQDAPNQNDVIRIVRNGGFVDIFRNDTVNPAFHLDYASLASLVVNSAGGNDSITMDYSGGNPIPAGGVTLNGGSGADTLFIAGSTASATFLDLTIAGSGTMSMGSSSALPNVTDLTVAAGEIFTLNGQIQTIDSLNGQGIIRNNVASNIATLTVGQQGGSGNFGGSLQNGAGTLALTKSGSGTLSLSGVNSYTGLSIISGGTIEAGSSASFVGLAGQIRFNGGRLHVTGDSTAANIDKKFTTSYSGATSSSTATFDIDQGVTLTIGGTAGASIQTDGGGSRGGAVTKTGGGTLRILSDNGQLDHPVSFLQGTIIVETFKGLGGADNSNNRVDMSDGTTLVLRNNSGTNYLTPLKATGAGAEINVIVDRASTGGGITHSVNALTSDGAFILNLNLGSNITSGTGGVTITNSTTLSGDAIFSTTNGTSAATVLTTGPISGGFGITRTDNGTMVLSGANTYGGATNIENGTLRLGPAGTLPSTTNLTLGDDTQAGTLDLNGHSATVNSIFATGDNVNGNRILNLNPGQTLSVTGALGGNALYVGGLSGANDQITRLIISGGGALSVVSSGNILVDNDAIDTSSAHEATLDLSALSDFVADVANLNIGVGPTNGPRARGLLTLAATNSITADAITIGKTTGNAAGGSVLYLGQSNTLSANTITIASGKGSSATLAFRSGLTNPAVTITDKNSGMGSDLLLGYKSNSGTASPVGVADFSGGVVNATLKSLVLGWQSQNSGNTASGVFTMSAGTVSTSALTLGRADFAAAAANGTLNINGGVVNIAGPITPPTVGATSRTYNLAGNGLLRIVASGGARALSATALNISGAATLDLTDNKLIVSDDVGSWNGSSYTGVTGLVQAGRGDGSWNGVGIMTSMSDPTTGVLTTLAVALADDVGYAGGTFGGVSVNSGDVLVMYTWGGDADLNGELNGDDYFFIDSNILNQAPGFHNGDFDYNGVIDGDDYFIIDSNIVFAQSQPKLADGGQRREY